LEGGIAGAEGLVCLLESIGHLLGRGLCSKKAVSECDQAQCSQTEARDGHDLFSRRLGLAVVLQVND
jgi:hypothetical protein